MIFSIGNTIGNNIIKALYFPTTLINLNPSSKTFTGPHRKKKKQKTSTLTFASNTSICLRHAINN